MQMFSIQHTHHKSNHTLEKWQRHSFFSVHLYIKWNASVFPFFSIFITYFTYNVSSTTSLNALMVAKISPISKVSSCTLIFLFFSFFLLFVSIQISLYIIFSYFMRETLKNENVGDDERFCKIKFYLLTTKWSLWNHIHFYLVPFL